MIQLNSAGKRFGEKVLFQDASWQINPGDGIGLVGANGTGKTTLLKILAGLETLDYGSLAGTKGASAGYLPQYGLELSGRTIFAECMSVFENLRLAEVEMESLTREMARLDPDGREYAEVGERFHRLEHEFRTLDGYALDAQVGAVLSGLGFPKEDWRRRTEEFSGGWQMRVALAKLLLERPNLLLLDEPTNHLDLEARNWLEQYLASYPYAFVLVSHDRYFLDVAVRKVVEIWNSRLHFYAGNYSRYVELKTERRAQLEAAQRNQQDKIRQLEAFINRFRYTATKAKQVQSRIKELERMEKIELPPEEEKTHPLFVPAAQSQRAGGGRISRRRQVLRREARLHRRQLHHRARGPHRAGGRERRRQVHPHPNAGGERAAQRGRVQAGAQRRTGLLRPGPVQGTRSQHARARRPDGDRAAHHRRPACAACSAVSCSPRTMCSSRSACFPEASATGTRWPVCCSVPPTSCCWTSRPTTWTCAPRTSCSSRSRSTRARWCSSRTTATSSTSWPRGSSKWPTVRSGCIPGNYEDYLWRKSAQTVEEAAPALALDAASQPASPPEAKPRRLNPIRLRQMQERREAIEEEVARHEAEISEVERELAEFRSTEETKRLSTVLDARRAELSSLLTEWEDLSRAIEEARG